MRTTFSWFPCKQRFSYMKKSKFANDFWQPLKLFRWLLPEIGRWHGNLNLSNSPNTLSISTSVEGKSWDHQYCCLVIQRSPLLTQIKYLFTLHFLAPVICLMWFLPKLNDLKCNVQPILRSSHEKNSWKQVLWIF